MRRREFLELLEETLSNNEEKESILKYYNDLILDAIDLGRREEEVISEFEIYPKLKRRSKVFEAIEDYERKPSVKSSSRAIKVILAFFATPILLPLGIAVFSILLSLFIVLLSLVVSFGASALSVIFGSIGFFYQIKDANISAYEYMCYIGIALTAFSILSALTYYSVVMLKISFSGFIKFFGKCLRKKGVKYEKN